MALNRRLERQGVTNCFCVSFNITLAEGERLKGLARERGMPMAGLARELIRREIGTGEEECPKSDR